MQLYMHSYFISSRHILARDYLFVQDKAKPQYGRYGNRYSNFLFVHSGKAPFFQATNFMRPFLLPRFLSKQAIALFCTGSPRWANCQKGGLHAGCPFPCHAAWAVFLPPQATCSFPSSSA